MYANILPGVFLERPNRFIAYVDIGGKTQVCHVKNTGRCRELLIPGARVFVQKAANPNRKTQYDLISVYKGNLLVNIDSSAPNRVFHEWLQEAEPWGPMQSIRPESRWGHSRFDFFVETARQKVFVEVKGVTLEEGGVARFPDAPTERGVKHLEELALCQREGYHGVIAFIIQMKGVHVFRPNDPTHARFGQALREAAGQGVEVLAMDCRVTPDGLCVDEPIRVDLT